MMHLEELMQLQDVMPDPLSVPVFLFTIPTHWTAGIAALFLSFLFFLGPEITTQGLFMVWFFSMLPDMIDNPESRPGMVFSGLVKVLTFGKVDLGRYVEHRGFWHSISALALMTGLAYLIYPEVAPYLFIGMGSHVYIDGAQRRGISLMGFGEWKGRLWRKLEIPSGRKEEFYFMASTLLIILLGSWVVSEGGTRIIICKKLGTLECTIRLLLKCRAEGRECTLALEDAQSQPGGSSLLSGDFPEPEAVGLARIVFRKNGVPYSLGHASDDNYFAGRNSFIRFGEKNKTCRFSFRLNSQPLGSLKDLINTPLPNYRISGNVLLHEPLNVPIFHSRYNTISGNGSQLKLTFATLPDIEAYSLQHVLIESADLELAYYVKADEECRWKAPGEFPSASPQTMTFTAGRNSKLLVKEGDLLAAGALVAINTALDEEIRILERELQAEIIQAERREQEHRRQDEIHRRREGALSAELAEKEKTVSQLERIQGMNPSQLSDEAGKRAMPNVSPNDLSLAARRLSASLLERAAKEQKEAREKLERLREGWTKELHSDQTAKEQSALKVQKLSAKHSELKDKREIRASAGGKILRIEKSFNNGKMRIKILLLARKVEVGQN